MTLRRAIALLALLVLGYAPTAGAAQPTVILLSWDGTRHDAPERTALPALARMEREGARAERLVPPFPSNTFPAHVTLATGTHPDRHGIVGNRFIDPERGEFDRDDDASWIEAEPLWIAAERQGVRTAVFFWVGSQTDWHGLRASHRQVRFDKRIPESDKVDQLLAWLDLPPPERPQLLMAWWRGGDDRGHADGPDAASVMRQLAAQDAQLARLQAGIDARDLWGTTTLLVVSDHGMTAVGPGSDAEGALADAKVDAQVVAGGGHALVYLADPADLPRARRALEALPGVTAFPRAEIPERLRARHPRVGDLLLLIEPPGQFAPEKLRLLGLELDGTHGFDPQHPDMGGIFLALGRGVPAGTRLPALPAVDVAPTVAALLGIEAPRDAEGRARLPLEPGP